MMRWYSSSTATYSSAAAIRPVRLRCDVVVSDALHAAADAAATREREHRTVGVDVALLEGVLHLQGNARRHAACHDIAARTKRAARGSWSGDARGRTALRKRCECVNLLTPFWPVRARKRKGRQRPVAATVVRAAASVVSATAATTPLLSSPSPSTRLARGAPSGCCGGGVAVSCVLLAAPLPRGEAPAALLPGASSTASLKLTPCTGCVGGGASTGSGASAPPEGVPAALREVMPPMHRSADEGGCAGEDRRDAGWAPVRQKIQSAAYRCCC